MRKSNAVVNIRLNGDRAPCEGADATGSSTALDRAERLANAGQLAAGLAHEMNTPLGSISGHAEESLEIIEQLRSGQTTADRLDDLRARQLAIMRQASRCGRITSRLLQFAQRAYPAGEECRPGQVIQEVAELFAALAHEKGVQLEHGVTGSLPDAAVGAAELEQLLVNLVQNSLDACDQGDRICLEASCSGGSLRFVVEDTGCGIAPEILNRVFDPFFTTKPSGRGTGLGLSVCLGIVRRAGGTIEVGSELHRGTRITVVLPVRKGGRS